LVAFNASSILYLISLCSVLDAHPTLIFAILPVNFHNLSFNFSNLKASFSQSIKACTSSILFEISHFQPETIVLSLDIIISEQEPVTLTSASSSFIHSFFPITVASTNVAKSFIISFWYHPKLGNCTGTQTNFH